MTPKENLLAMLKGEPTDALINGWEPFELVFDPLGGKFMCAVPGQYVKTPWGVTVYLGEDEPGVIPIVNDETKVISDITEWRDQLTIPPVEEWELDWTAAKAQVEDIRSRGKLAMVLLPTGLFEQAHELMGFEDTLVNLLAEPDDLHDLLDALLEERMAHTRLVMENLHPDVVLHHDDWGTKTSLFMRAETWREFFKDRYAKLFAYMKEQGAIVMHHSDSFCEPIVQDMVDMGVDIWQGVLPTNDIPRLQRELGGKLVLMGGIDSGIDRKDVTEEEIRTEVRRACDAYVPGGNFIPSMTYGGRGSIFPGVNDTIEDEVAKLSAKYF